MHDNIHFRRVSSGLPAAIIKSGELYVFARKAARRMITYFSN
jgi:hypothetical protein